MSHQPPITQRISFVGEATFDWDIDATLRGYRSWKFLQAIDSETIGVGSRISIKSWPLHQERPHSSQNSPSTLPPPMVVATRVTLLEGKVLGVRHIKKGKVTFTIRNENFGGYTTLEAPATSTAISLKGGWLMKALPLWAPKGPVIRYPIRVSAADLKRPGRAAERAMSPTYARNPDLGDAILV